MWVMIFFADMFVCMALPVCPSRDLIGNFAFGTSIVMLFFDTFLYAVLAWYLDQVWPREFGVAQPWYFLVSPRYWRSWCRCGSRRRVNEPQSLSVPLIHVSEDAQVNVGPDWEPG